MRSGKCDVCGVQGGHSQKCARFIPIQLERIAGALERIAATLEEKKGHSEKGNCELCGRQDAMYFVEVGGVRRFRCPIHEPRDTSNRTNGIR